VSTRKKTTGGRPGSTRKPILNGAPEVRTWLTATAVLELLDRSDDRLQHLAKDVNDWFSDPDHRAQVEHRFIHNELPGSPMLGASNTVLYIATKAHHPPVRWAVTTAEIIHGMRTAVDLTDRRTSVVPPPEPWTPTPAREPEVLREMDNAAKHELPLLLSAGWNQSRLTVWRGGRPLRVLSPVRSFIPPADGSPFAEFDTTPAGGFGAIDNYTLEMTPKATAFNPVLNGHSDLIELLQSLGRYAESRVKPWLEWLDANPKRPSIPLPPL
jgi:hypothetical protein